MAGQPWDMKGIYVFQVETDPIKIKQSIKRMEELSLHIETISRIGDHYGWDSKEMKAAQVLYKKWQDRQKEEQPREEESA